MGRGMGLPLSEFTVQRPESKLAEDEEMKLAIPTVPTVYPACPLIINEHTVSSASVMR